MKLSRSFKSGMERKIGRMNPKYQQGDFLIEAIIGLALMAIVGIGVVHMSDRISLSKRETSVQDLVINQLRDLLVKNGSGSLKLCGTGASQAPTINIPGRPNPVAVSVDCGSTSNITINSVTVSGVQQPVILSVKTIENDDSSLISVGGTQ